MVPEPRTGQGAQVAVETIVHDYVRGEAAECEEEIHDRGIGAREGGEKLRDFSTMQRGFDTRDGAFAEERRDELAAFAGFGEGFERLEGAGQEGVVVPYAVEGGVYAVDPL
jgi:hypothetical protein